jgi:hypothetical protein
MNFYWILSAVVGALVIGYFFGYRMGKIDAVTDFNLDQRQQQMKQMWIELMKRMGGKDDQ